MPSLGFLAIAVAPSLERVKGFRPVVFWALYGGVLLNLSKMNSSFLDARTGWWLAAGIAGSAVLAVLVLAIRSRRPRHALAAAGALLLASAAVTSIDDLSRYRDQTRWTHYRRHVDLHDFPREFVTGWEALDHPTEPRTVALATGWVWPGHNWYFYPLMGSRLQNHVLYVPVNRRGVEPTHVDSGMLRTRVDECDWLSNLKELEVDRVIIQAPFPEEQHWMAARPSQFRRVVAEPFVEVYEVTRQPR